ncbi:MAG TPA: hypothetical protein VEK57_03490 [Thermoanaerobaculia bacterium]|nr:hypothetical protein [Thermoanaerobaculia bacterium]
MQSAGPRALVVDYTPTIVQLVRAVLHTMCGSITSTRPAAVT